MSPKKAAQGPVKTATRSRQSTRFTDDDRAAMRERGQKLEASGRLQPARLVCDARLREDDRGALVIQAMG